VLVADRPREDRPDEIDLSTLPSSGILFAPIIGLHDRTFSIANMLTHGSGRQGNFLTAATGPAGPCSDRIWLEEAPGSDPLILCDVTGRAWLCRSAKALATGSTCSPASPSLRLNRVDAGPRGHCA